MFEEPQGASPSAVLFTQEPWDSERSAPLCSVPLISRTGIPYTSPIAELHAPELYLGSQVKYASPHTVFRPSFCQLLVGIRGQFNLLHLEVCCWEGLHFSGEHSHLVVGASGYVCPALLEPGFWKITTEASGICR